MKRHLVTTADIRTWKFDRPILFLGEWCRRYDLLRQWSAMDAIVAKPFGVTSPEKIKNKKYIDELTNQLLKELTKSLNEYHHTQHSTRYWHILLGHWLNRYVEVLFNRYFTIEEVLKSHDLAGTTIFKTSMYCFAASNTFSFIDICRDDSWNHCLFADIIDFTKGVETEVIHFPLEISKAVRPNSNKTSIRTWVYNLVSIFLETFSRETDAFISKSYLPKLLAIKLYLALGQCPQIRRQIKIQSADYSIEKRTMFRLDFDKHTGFEYFIRNRLAKFIPVCYLEGYDRLTQQAELLPWPTKPRFIFTSNSFDTDEVFKVWSAQKVEEGVPYFVGQHGNNYGTVNNYYSHEQLTCDKFFTWGWSDNNIKNIPSFLFKTVGRKSDYNPKGGLLLIERNLYDRLYQYDDSFESGLYQETQFKFVDLLTKNIQQNLTVRLSTCYKSRDWFDDVRWNDFNPSIKLNKAEGRIEKLIKQSRLVVHSYDSTGILETLSLNIPTMCFWYNGLDYLTPSAIPFYESLQNVGILATSAEEAAKLVVEHWPDVDKWWGSKEVQEARRAFCNRYAKSEQFPIRTLKALLTSHELK